MVVDKMNNPSEKGVLDCITVYSETNILKYQCYYLESFKLHITPEETKKLRSGKAECALIELLNNSNRLFKLKGRK